MSLSNDIKGDFPHFSLFHFPNISKMNISKMNFPVREKKKSKLSFGLPCFNMFGLT